jgi:hypothetical protein
MSDGICAKCGAPVHRVGVLWFLKGTAKSGCPEGGHHETRRRDQAREAETPRGVDTGGQP